MYEGLARVCADKDIEREGGREREREEEEEEEANEDYEVGYMRVAHTLSFTSKRAMSFECLDLASSSPAGAPATRSAACLGGPVVTV
jgi:hypothetical protein